MLVSKITAIEARRRTEDHQMLYKWQVLKMLLLMAVLYLYISIGDVKSL